MPYRPAFEKPPTCLSYLEHVKASCHIRGNFFSSAICAVVKWSVMLPQSPWGLLAHAQQVEVLQLCSVPLREIELSLKLPTFNSSTKPAMVCKGRKLLQIINISQALAPVWISGASADLPPPPPHGCSSVTAKVILRTLQAKSHQARHISRGAIW